MENQLSRYGAISKVLPLMAPNAKVHFVGKSSLSTHAELLRQFGPDRDGGNRIFATITAALDDANVVASRGDVILVLPGYTETVTEAITVDKAGLSIIGLGNGTARPTITGNGTIDAVDITAADVTFKNFHFAAPETDAQTSFINVQAVDGVTIADITGVGSQTSKNVVDCITVVAGSDRLTIDNINFYNATVAVNSFLNVEGACANVVVKNFRAYGEVVAGGIIDGGLISDLHLENICVCVTGTTKPAITLDSNPTGTAQYVFGKGTDTTIANNVALGNALALFEVRVLEQFSVQGGLIPAADAE